MSAATTAPTTELYKRPEPFIVTVEGFQYRVYYSPLEFGGTISHFEFYHCENGEEVKKDCPLTETGYRSHFFKPCIMDSYETREEGAIAAIANLQDVTRYKNRENERRAAETAAAQYALF